MYMSALVLSWTRDGLPADPEAFRRIIGADRDEWDNASEWLLERFPVAEDGMRRNPRQEGERGKASDKRTKATDAAHSRWQKTRDSEEQITDTSPHVRTQCGRITLSFPLKDPLNTPEIQEALEAWVSMRKKTRAPLVSQQGYTRAANRLYEVSLGDPKRALEIIARSEENCWKSFFPLAETKDDEDDVDIWGCKKPKWR
jgi:uncharacterized protein YdaU (DUF1376 family)